MKFQYLITLYFFALFVRHSTQQDISYSGTNDGVVTSNPITDQGPPPAGIVGTFRNTTNGFLKVLEGPRDRVLEFIKPVVKSDFSRNVTSVLNNIWNRVHQSNSTILHNPLFRNSIVIPVNTTLARLKEITRADDEHSELDESNLEVVNLNQPEGEAQFREYLQASSNADQAVSNPSLIFLVRDDNNDSNLIASESEEVLTETQLPTEASSTEQTNPIETNPIETDNEVRNNDLNEKPANENELRDQATVAQPDDVLNPTKSIQRRSARFLERNQYLVVTPTRIRHLFDNVRRHNKQECMALALCEANCRPHRYENTRHSQFRNLFERSDSFGADHEDYDYYSKARGYGLRYSGKDQDCEMCHSYYRCDEDREELIHRMSNFN